MVQRRRYTLGKNERLKSRKLLEELFNSGESFSIFPLKIYFLLNQSATENAEIKKLNPSAIQFGVGVGKKNFKRAVDRNRIKRLIREVYRVRKNLIADILREKEWHLKIFILYVGKEMPDYLLIEEKVLVVLEKMQKKLTSK
jgi:ribonuclease P protein component